MILHPEIAPPHQSSRHHHRNSIHRLRYQLSNCNGLKIFISSVILYHIKPSVVISEAVLDDGNKSKYGARSDTTEERRAVSGNKMLQWDKY